jgi:hypothetical protein
MMNFMQALATVFHGDHVTRESWDNPKLVFKMNKGQLCVRLDDGLDHPLIISQEDIDGEDYMIVPQPGPRVQPAPIMVPQVQMAPMKAAPAPYKMPAVAPPAAADELDPRDKQGIDQ